LDPAMNTPPPPDDEQRALWNGVAGQAWVDEQQLLDGVLQPFEDLLVDALPAGSAHRVLDIGCGTGSTTLAMARRVGIDGRCTGIDISEPMIALARERAVAERSRAEFICADAQTHAFEPASFDRLISRFGTMFFADPVRAFANLRRAACEGAALQCVAWRSGVDNPFMTTAERAAAPLLPNLPARQPGAPGQLSFADPARVDTILRSSGWRAIDIRPIDVACSMPASALRQYVARLGPVGRVLHDTPEPLRTRVIETVCAAFAPYVQGDTVRFTSACWMIGARAAGPR
jgi:SAM-dependent methyltransferase